MNSRKFCACGCKRSVADRRRGTKWATPTCRSSWRSRQELAQRGSGGLQVSYLKAMTHLMAVGVDWRLAEHALKQALPVRQRARLEARTR